MTAPALVLNDRGVPEPPSDIQRRLREIDPDLHLRFSGGQFALAFRWRQDDPRRQMIRAGEMNPGDDFDIYGFLPHDCAADEAYGYVVANLRSWSQASTDAKGMLERVHHYNREQERKNAQPVVDYADELIDANKHTLGRADGIVGVKPVYQSEPTRTTGRKRRKGRPVD